MRKLGNICLFTCTLVLVCMLAPAWAVPVTPVYTAIFNDAVTGDSPNPISSGGNLYWAVDNPADSYPNDVYERPTTQTFTSVGGGIVGAVEYYGNLDIVQAKAGLDSQYLYVAIDMFSTLHQKTGESKNEGLIYRYGFRISTSANDGANGFLFTADQPSSFLPATTYQLLKNEGFRDTNGDVGGAGGIGVTGEAGNGYNLAIIGDGKLLTGTKAPVLFSRISPTDPTVVEFALDYVALSLTQNSLQNNLLYFQFEAIKGGPKDPQNYLWNDEYSSSQAGTPYTTAGTQNIYELDTLRGGSLTQVPEPSAFILLGSGLLVVRVVARTWAKRSR